MWAKIMYLSHFNTFEVSVFKKKNKKKNMRRHDG